MNIRHEKLHYYKNTTKVRMTKMKTSIKTLTADSLVLTADDLKKIAEKADFETCTERDKFYYVVVRELQNALTAKDIRVVTSIDYVDADRDTSSYLFYVVSSDTANNVSKQLCKVYLKKALNAHIVVNACMKQAVNDSEVLHAVYDEKMKKYLRLKVDDLTQLVKVVKALIAVSAK